jgi:protein-disulfide isomerase
MADKKSNNTKIMLIVGVLLLAFVAALAFTMQSEEPSIDTASTETVQTAETSAEESYTLTQADIDNALGDRIIGNTGAPMKIVEHASFTCSHCGDFHKHTFDQLKSNYFDTGKAYLVFADFPLNGPAMEASKVARCVPSDKYFDFVSLLFKEQETWISDQDYRGWLKTKAGEYGLPAGKFDACINSTEIEEGIKAWMKVAQEEFDVVSTPSFIINNKTNITGAYQYEAFAELLKQEEEKAKKEASDETAIVPMTAPLDSPTPEVMPSDENEAASAASPEAPVSEETPPQE